MDDKRAVKLHGLMLTGLIALTFVLVLSITIPTETLAQDPSVMNFTVTNSAPSVGTVTCAQATPSESTNYMAWCYAILTDSNGYQDISGCNGTFFRTSVGQTGAPNDNNRYSNGSCQLVGGSGNTINCNCSYAMKYYADGNVEWTGNLTAKDPSSSAYTADLHTLSQLLALDLTTNKVQWGSLVVGTSTTFNIYNYTQANNTGNVNESIQVAAAAADMDCVPSPADIAVANIKNWIQTGNYVDCTASPNPTGCQLTNTQQEINPVAWIDNRQHTPNGVENRTIYWALSVPTGVNGTCTITVNQYASAGNPS